MALALRRRDHAADSPHGGPYSATGPRRWLNQLEIYLGAPEPKVFTPAGAASHDRLDAGILAISAHDEILARPFEWTLTRADLARLIERLVMRGFVRAKAA